MDSHFWLTNLAGSTFGCGEAGKFQDLSGMRLKNRVLSGVSCMLEPLRPWGVPPRTDLVNGQVASAIRVLCPSRPPQGHPGARVVNTHLLMRIPRCEGRPPRSRRRPARGLPRWIARP
jgi:hypothetical protein